MHMTDEHVIFWTKLGKAGEASNKFNQQAAKILSTISASALFTSSRVKAGEIQFAENRFKEGIGEIRGEGDIKVIIENDRITNLYDRNGDLNIDVLSACLNDLEKLPVISPKDPRASNLSERYSHSTGRDRLLDYMSSNSQRASKHMRGEAQEVLDEIYAMIIENMIKRFRKYYAANTEFLEQNKNDQEKLMKFYQKLYKLIKEKIKVEGPPIFQKKIQEFVSSSNNPEMQRILRVEILGLYIAHGGCDEDEERIKKKDPKAFYYSHVDYLFKSALRKFLASINEQTHAPVQSDKSKPNDGSDGMIPLA
jgi:hypothetical protein